MTRRRRLKPEELELWREATKSTKSLHRRQTFDPEAYAPPPTSPKPASPPAPRLQLDGKSPPQPAARKTSFDLAPSLPEKLRQTPVQMDRKAFTRMKRGKLRPEARIDLHGMTLDRAHGVLTGFIRSAHGQGKRFVLVITGKGKHRDDGGPIPVRHGVLRHQVPQWLRTDPLSSMVLQIEQAHTSHGGAGAYYVYLRRQR